MFFVILYAMRKSTISYAQNDDHDSVPEGSNERKTEITKKTNGGNNRQNQRNNRTTHGK